MDRDGQQDTTTYRAVINHEEQYAIWPTAKELPHGWRDAGKEGPRADVLAFIEGTWTSR